MAENTRRTIAQRSWPLAEVAEGQTPWLWVTHTATTKDVGLPGEIIEHKWELEAKFPRIGRDTERMTVTLVQATDQASFDNLLNDVRQAIVDARTWTQAGGLP